MLSESDQARELAAAVRGVTASRWDVQRRLDRARSLDDRMAVRCLDARLTEVDATLRMLGEQRERFMFAPDGDGAAHRARSFRRAMALRAHATEVSREAHHCQRGGEAVGGSVTVLLAEPP